MKSFFKKRNRSVFQKNIGAALLAMGIGMVFSFHSHSLQAQDDLPIGSITKGFEYPLWSKEGKKKLVIHGSEAVAVRSNLIRVRGLNIDILKDEKPHLTVSSKEGDFWREEKRLTTTQYVKIKHPGFKLSSQKMDWDLNESIGTFQKEVEVIVIPSRQKSTSDKLDKHLLTQVQSDYLRLDLAKHRGNFNGNIKITDPKFRVTSKELVSYFSESNQLERLVAIGDVEIAEKRSKRKAKSHKADYNIQEKKILLTGEPMVVQAGSNVSGTVIAINTESDVMNVSGQVRVQMLSEIGGGKVTDVTSEKLQIDFKKKEGVFRGKVKIKGPEFVWEAQELISHFNDLAKPDRFVAKGDVLIVQSGGKIRLSSREAEYQFDKDQIRLEGDPVVHTGENQVSGSVIIINLKTGEMRVTGNSKGRFVMPSQPGEKEQITEITGKEFVLTSRDQAGAFRGGVELTNGDFVLEAEELPFYLDKEQQLERVVARKNVVINQETENRSAKCDEAEYTVADRVLKLTGGPPVLMEKDNRLTGAVITYKPESNEWKVDGGSKLQIFLD